MGEEIDVCVLGHRSSPHSVWHGGFRDLIGIVPVAINKCIHSFRGSGSRPIGQIFVITLSAFPKAGSVPVGGRGLKYMQFHATLAYDNLEGR